MESLGANQRGIDAWISTQLGLIFAMLQLMTSCLIIIAACLRARGTVANAFLNDNFFYGAVVNLCRAES